VKLRKIVVGMGVAMYLVGWGMVAGMALDAYRMALEKHAGGER
jgi:hypothetical protein